MKKIIFSFLLLFFSFSVFSQSTFGDRKDVVTLRSNETVSMMPGQTVVLLPQEDKKEEFVPLKATWKPEVEYVQIPSFFNNL